LDLRYLLEVDVLVEVLVPDEEERSCRYEAGQKQEARKVELGSQDADESALPNKVTEMRVGGVSSRAVGHGPGEGRARARDERPSAFS
jgi:hypothetical protein